jgi:hypothetical protein
LRLIIQFFLNGVKYTATIMLRYLPEAIISGTLFQTDGSPSTTSQKGCVELTSPPTKPSLALLLYRYHSGQKKKKQQKKTPSPEPSHRAGRGGLSGPASGGKFFSAPARDSPERHKGGDRIAEGGNSHTRGR